MKSAQGARGAVLVVVMAVMFGITALAGAVILHGLAVEEEAVEGSLARIRARLLLSGAVDYLTSRLGAEVPDASWESDGVKLAKVEQIVAELPEGVEYPEESTSVYDYSLGVEAAASDRDGDGNGVEEDDGYLRLVLAPLVPSPPAGKATAPAVVGVERRLPPLWVDICSGDLPIAERQVATRCMDGDAERYDGNFVTVERFWYAWHE